MTRENYRLYGDERPLPYWVRLGRIDGGTAGRRDDDPLQALVHLDLRGGEFTRTSWSRLVRIFDWLTRGHKIRVDNLVDYCLEITPLDPDQDFRVTDASIAGRRPQTWPARRGETFRWLPVAYDEHEKEYAWQK